MKLLILVFILVTSIAFAQMPTQVPNATVTAKGCTVLIPLRYADAPMLATLFYNVQPVTDSSNPLSMICGTALRYSQCMSMNRQQNRYGQGNQGFGQGGWQQGGQGFGQGQNQGFGGRGRGRGNNGGW